MDTLRGALEKQKVDAEQKIAELSSSNTELSSKLAVYTEETERGQSALQMYREQVIKLFSVAKTNRRFQTSSYLHYTYIMVK